MLSKKIQFGNYRAILYLEFYCAVLENGEAMTEKLASICGVNIGLF